MQAAFAKVPNTGMKICLNPWKLSCSMNATMVTMQVTMYSMNVPKLLIKVTISSVLGSVQIGHARVHVQSSSHRAQRVLARLLLVIHEDFGQLDQIGRASCRERV